jgi:hypothetical protein
MLWGACGVEGIRVDRERAFPQRLPLLCFVWRSDGVYDLKVAQRTIGPKIAKEPS